MWIRIITFTVVWMALTAVAFSAVDWRQTKHLMPLMLPLCLAPAHWAATGRVARLVVAVALAALLLWNLCALGGLAADFAVFRVTPAW